MHTTLELQTSTTHATGVDDGILVKRALQGDQRAFESLVHRYTRPLLGYILLFLKDRELAQDVLQQVFLQLSLSLSTLKTDGALHGWLFHVAHNRCVDELRKRQYKQLIRFSELEREDNGEDLVALESIPDLQALPEEIVERLDQRHMLHHAMGTVAPKIRLILYLHCSRDMSFPEISELLNIPLPSVKSYFYRSLPRLRTALLDQGYHVKQEKKDASSIKRCSHNNHPDTFSRSGQHRQSTSSSRKRRHEPTPALALPCIAAAG
jgi:RNA polymerase sigma factor (sigma-70 family)